MAQAKGYRVGPVYDDVLSMAWFFLELIVKSMALEQSRSYCEAVPPGLFSIIAFSLFMRLVNRLKFEIKLSTKFSTSLPQN